MFLHPERIHITLTGLSLFRPACFPVTTSLSRARAFPACNFEPFSRTFLSVNKDQNDDASCSFLKTTLILDRGGGEWVSREAAGMESKEKQAVVLEIPP